MAAHPDIELQILQHLRALREEVAALRAKIDGLERRLDGVNPGAGRADGVRQGAES